MATTSGGREMSEGREREGDDDDSERGKTGGATAARRERRGGWPTCLCEKERGEGKRRKAGVVTGATWTDDVAGNRGEFGLGGNLHGFVS